MIQILEEYKAKRGHYPGSKDFKNVKGLPNIRQVERRGGIEHFYKQLGIVYTKQSRGQVRANANDYAYYSENDFYNDLTPLFGEVAVHRQSPYSTKSKTLCRSDFKIYPANKEPFFIDVFSASDMHNFSGCVNIKLRKLASLNPINHSIYMVSLNEEFVNEHAINYYINHRKTPLPQNIRIFTRSGVLEFLKQNY